MKFEILFLYLKGFGDETVSVLCEFVLEKTPYREVRWQRVPPLPIEFQSTVMDFSNNCNIHTLFIANFYLIIIQLSVIHIYFDCTVH